MRRWAMLGQEAAGSQPLASEERKAWLLGKLCV
jgi:hypothetical protein